MSVHSSSEQQHGVGEVQIVVVFPGQWWVCRPEDMRDWFLAGSREQNDHGKNVIVCADAKAFSRVLQARGIDARRTCHFAEPRVAEWMLDPESMSELGDLRGKYGVPEILLMSEDVVGQGTEKQHQLMHAAFHEDLRLYKHQLKQEDEKGGIAGAAAPAASTFQAVRPERNKGGAAFGGFDLDAAHASLRAFEQGMPPALGNFVAGVPSFPTTSAAPGAQRHHAQQQRQLPPLQLQRTSFPLLHCVNEAFSCLYLMSAIFSPPPPTEVSPSAAYAIQVKRELQAAFVQQIMPFHLVIGQMEDQGMPFDVNWPSYFRIVYKTAALQERAKEIVGRRINLASTEDCGAALFEDLDIPVPQGVRFARKKNGRKKFRSPKEILQAVLREEEARVAAEAAAALVESPGKAANAAVQPAAAASLDGRKGNKSNSKPSKSLSSGNTSSSDDNSSDEDEELGTAKQAVPGKKSRHGDQGGMISEAEESDNDDVNEGGDQGGSKTEPECFLPNQFWARNPGFELIDHITEYRHLTHVQTKFNKLRRCAAPEHQGAQYNLQRGGPSTSTTGGGASSSSCAAPLPKSVAPAVSAIADHTASAPGEAEGQASGLPHRVRSTFAYTATGRIVVRCGGPQLLCVDNPFEIIDVTRSSFQQERIKQLLKPVPVLVGVAAALPPMCRYRNGYALWVGGEDDDSRSRRGEQLQQDHLAVRMQEREELENAGGRKNAVDRVVWDDSIASVCQYWADRGWKIYENADYVKTLRRVIVQLGNFSGNTLDDYDPESPNASNTSRKLLAFFNKDTTTGGGQSLQERGEGGVGDGRKIDRRSYLSYPSDQVWRSQAPVFAGAIAQNQNQNALAGAEGCKSGAATSATRPTTTHRRISVNLRECFRFPRSTRKLFLSVDYCQLEVRLLAYYSGDKSLQAHLMNSQTDLFRAIAAQWLQKSELDIGAEERAGAKKIVYGLIYGMGPKRVAADLGISEAEGRNFMKRFDDQFPKVKDWVKAVRKAVVETREITTLYGRKRFFHAGCPRTEAEYREMLLAAGAPARADVNKGAGKGAARSKAPPFRQLVSKIERQGVNSICQASAADLMMQAMLNLDKATLRIPVSTTSPCMSPAHSSPAPAAARNQEEFNCKPLLDYHNAADYQVRNGGPTTSTLTPPSSCRLILQIHDELLFEVADDVLPLALPVIVECMTRPGADIAPVPLQVKCRVGTDWGNLKEVDLKK
eukprot:g5761.t1